MARSIQEIYDAIIASKEQEPELDGLTPLPTDYASFLSDLTSASKVAIWRKLAYLFALAAYVLETMWDLFKLDVETIIETNRVGRLAWYVEKSRAFQLGDTLVDTGMQPGYATDNPAARIVSQASAREEIGQIYLKVAKGTAPALQPLTPSELAAFEGYVSQIKVAGIDINISSLAADVLTMTATVRYDAQRPLADVRADVEEAIEGYVALLAEPFDGEFRTIRLVDAVQEVVGVVDFYADSLTATPAGGSAVSFERSYVAAAGYMAFDIANSSITYTPA